MDRTIRLRECARAASYRALLTNVRSPHPMSNPPRTSGTFRRSCPRGRYTAPCALFRSSRARISIPASGMPRASDWTRSESTMNTAKILFVNDDATATTARAMRATLGILGHYSVVEAKSIGQTVALLKQRFRNGTVAGRGEGRNRRVRSDFGGVVKTRDFRSARLRLETRCEESWGAARHRRPKRL